MNAVAATLRWLQLARQPVQTTSLPRPRCLAVRDMRNDDLAHVREIYLQARQQAFHWIAMERLRSDDFDRDTNGERVLVVTNSGGPLGFASMNEQGKFLHLLCVHPLSQGRGLGKFLLAGCEPFMRGPWTLQCSSINVRARDFYQAQGWRTEGEGLADDGPYLMLAR